MRHATPVAILVMALTAAAGQAQEPRADARADLKDRSGRTVGRATLEQTPSGVLVTAEFTSLPPGTHAFHVHETGKCDPPFESAGGHFNPTGKRHGVRASGGPHAGDLPNLFVPDSGRLSVQILAAGLVLKDGQGNLLDEDGAALVVHEKADDHASDPAGDAGGRIACGVITRPPK